jgi:mono/diheme cytochrome c family protein
MLLSITTAGKVVLLLVGISFIVFSLIAAVVLPRRNPGFPGNNLPAFMVACVAFFAVQIGAVLWVTGTQEVEKEEAVETAPAETQPATGETETQPAETQPAEGDAAAGKEVFASAGCGSCHTLADAGSAGSVGPNLDDRKPSAEQVADIVANGRGVMPSFGDQLDEQQIADVAAYVSSVAGQ